MRKWWKREGKRAFSLFFLFHRKSEKWKKITKRRKTHLPFFLIFYKKGRKRRISAKDGVTPKEKETGFLFSLSLLLFCFIFFSFLSWKRDNQTKCGDRKRHAQDRRKVEKTRTRRFFFFFMKTDDRKRNFPFFFFFLFFEERERRQNAEKEDGPMRRKNEKCKNRQ